ncbi:MAG: ABC transporter ATP-binding protein, partial [Treponema sp.]|nr:ABC transporter ATP-binding protein [Treponema sp.]
VRSLIREIGKTRTVIISTHILSEVEMLCNRVIIISGGKKVADSPTAILRQNYGQKTSVVLTVGGPSAEDAKSALETLPFVASCSTVMEDGKVNAVISLDEASASLKAGEDVRPSVALFVFDRKWDLYSLDLAKNSLEDVFRTLTTGGESNV